MMKILKYLFLGTIFLLMSHAEVNAESIDVWLGTSAQKPSKGIYHCLLNLDSGKLSDSTLVAEVEKPGFLAMHPRGSHLYAAATLDGVPSVVCYRIVSKGKNAKLELVNSAPTGDGGASHVSIDSQARMLLSAQYGGGSVASYSLNPDGSIQAQVQLIKHEGGAGVFENRQDAPHAHWTGFSPDEKYAFVPDLGLDQVVIYQVNTSEAKLVPFGSGELPPGSGPRHMKFHPNGKWVYVLNELSLTVSVFDFEAGQMTRRQTVATVPEKELELETFKSCSEIRVHPNGKYLYAANRGHDTITVFSIQSDGSVEAIQNIPIRGATPRNFNLSPDAQWLLAGGQNSHTLSSFRVDSETGRLTYNQAIISTPSPICVLFEYE